MFLSLSLSFIAEKESRETMGQAATPKSCDHAPSEPEIQSSYPKCVICGEDTAKNRKLCSECKDKQIEEEQHTAEPEKEEEAEVQSSPSPNQDQGEEENRASVDTFAQNALFPLPFREDVVALAVRKAKVEQSFNVVVKQGVSKLPAGQLMPKKWFSLLWMEFSEPNVLEMRLRSVQNEFITRLESIAWIDANAVHDITMTLNRLEASDEYEWWHELLKKPIDAFVLNQIIRLYVNNEMWAGLLYALKTCRLYIENKRFDTVFNRKKVGDVSIWELRGGSGKPAKITEKLIETFQIIYGPLPNSSGPCAQRKPDYLSTFYLSPGHLKIMLKAYSEPDDFIKVLNVSPKRLMLTFKKCPSISMTSDYVTDVLLALQKVYQATANEARANLIKGIEPHFHTFILHKVITLYADKELDENLFRNLQLCEPFWNNDMVKAIFRPPPPPPSPPVQSNCRSSDQTSSSHNHRNKGHSSTQSHSHSHSRSRSGSHKLRSAVVVVQDKQKPSTSAQSIPEAAPSKTSADIVPTNVLSQSQSRPLAPCTACKEKKAPARSMEHCELSGILYGLIGRMKRGYLNRLVWEQVVHSFTFSPKFRPADVVQVCVNEMLLV